MTPENPPVAYSGTEITLRDVFAAFALAGICASSHTHTEADEDTLAECAYLHADAMLARREK